MRILEVQGQGEALRWAKFLALALLFQGGAALLLRGLPQQQFVKAAPLEVELVAAAAPQAAPAAGPAAAPMHSPGSPAAAPVQTAVARPAPAPVPAPAPDPTAAAHPEPQPQPKSVLQQETPKGAVAAAHPAAVPSPGGEAPGPERSTASAVPRGGGGATASGGASGAREVLAQARPNYLHNPHPPYPPLAKRRGLTGSVVLKVLVGKEGGAKEVAVRSSSGHAVLDQAALATVAGWRFTPARRGEVPVESWVDVPIRFALNQREG